MGKEINLSQDGQGSSVVEPTHVYAQRSDQKQDPLDPYRFGPNGDFRASMSDNDEEGEFKAYQKARDRDRRRSRGSSSRSSISDQKKGVEASDGLFSKTRHAQLKSYKPRRGSTSSLRNWDTSTSEVVGQQLPNFQSLPNGNFQLEGAVGGEDPKDTKRQRSQKKSHRSDKSEKESHKGGDRDDFETVMMSQRVGDGHNVEDKQQDVDQLDG